MDIDKLIEKDIKDSIHQLRVLRGWLTLNIGNLSLKELKSCRAEIERMEIVIAIALETSTSDK